MQKQKQVIDARGLLKIFREDADAAFTHIMKSDETWFFCRHGPVASLARDGADVVPMV
jgi:hypothetical protein